MFCQERVRLCLVLEVVYSAPLHSCPTGRRPQRTAGTYVEKYSNQHYIWTVDRRECASVFIYKHRLLFSLQHTPAMRKSYVQWASDYSWAITKNGYTRSVWSQKRVHAGIKSKIHSTSHAIGQKQIVPVFQRLWPGYTCKWLLCIYRCTRVIISAFNRFWLVVSPSICFVPGTW